MIDIIIGINLKYDIYYFSFIQYLSGVIPLYRAHCSLTYAGKGYQREGTKVAARKGVHNRYLRSAELLLVSLSG